MSATATVHRAARGDAMTVLARWGLAARATIYVLIGLLAIAIARGSRQHEADQRGAMEELTRHTGGTVLVAIIGVGLAGYALWRLSEAAFGVVGDGKKAGPRLRSLARAVIYGFFAVSAFQVVTHAGTSQAGKQQFWSAKAMQHTGGRWLVGIVGAIVVICGLALIWEGLRRKFEKYLALGQMSPTTRKTVTALGVVGSVARGAVFAVVGVLVITAAVDYKPGKARGLDQALRELANTSPWLLVIVAVGLIIFGVYGYAEAAWRRT